jgi:hypothetical protein
VSNIAPADGANLDSFKGEDCRRMTIECEKFDLEGFTIPVNMYDGPNVARFQTRTGD